MHIGILQTGHAPDPVQEQFGDYSDFFTALLDDGRLTFSTWNVVDMEFPSGPDAADGWLITGSRHGAYEAHPFIPPLENLIRAIHAAARPLIGICFGHQIIAQAMGGTVEKWDGGWNIGRREYALGGETIALNAWHQDQVTRPPQGARTIASHPGCAHAGLLYGDRILTLQPHPEIQRPILARYLSELGPTGRFPEDAITAAAADLDKPNDERAMADLMTRFFFKEVTL